MKKIIIFVLLLGIGFVFASKSSVLAKRPSPVVTPPPGGVIICPDNSCAPLPTPEVM